MAASSLRAAAKASSSLQAQMSAVGYVYGGDALVGRVGRDGVREIDVVDGFARVNRAGTGLLMVTREALVALG